VDRGEIRHYQSSESVRLMSGDVFIIPPGFVHWLDFPDPNSVIYSLSFHEEMFHQGFACSNIYHFMAVLNQDTISDKRLDIRLKVVLDEDQRFIVESLLDSLLKEIDSEYLLELSAAPSLISAIMSIMYQAYFQNENCKDIFNNLAHYRQSMEACINYINENYYLPLSIDDLSSRYALSKSTFCFLFPHFTGMTLKRYLAQKRISQASILIKNSDMPINKIARLIGYKDLSTFYRNFIKITGLSPASYRSSPDK
jgi:AraC-like DNA-binding protein